MARATLAFLALLFAQAAAPAAAEFPQAAVMIVDTNRVMRDAKAMVSVAGQIERIRARYREELTARETKLRLETRTLADQRSVLAPDVYDRKLKDLRERLTALQEEARKRGVALDRARSEAVLRVRQSLFKVVRDLAKKQGANIVIQKSALVWADEEGMERTEEVLRRLDTVLPRVEIGEK